MAHFNKAQYELLQIEQNKRDDEMIKKGLIGNDGNRHDYEYDEKDHKYHTHMTNFEFYSKNDGKQLESCKKCSMWEKCSVVEHTLVTMKCIENSLTDDLTKEINKKIVEDLLKKRK